MPGFVFEHGEHGLMAAVNPVKVADGQRAGLRKRRVLVAAKDLHERDYRFMASRPGGTAIICLYIGDQQAVTAFSGGGLSGLMLNAGFQRPWRFV